MFLQTRGVKSAIEIEAEKIWVCRGKEYFKAILPANKESYPNF